MCIRDRANALLNRGKARTIKEAIDAVGISRSSYYKYKDDIFPIHEKIQGKTITFVMEMEDRPGLLSSILKVVADCKANILSIHQSIPCLLYTSAPCSANSTVRYADIFAWGTVTELWA